jgi:hypothetical protein
MKKKVKKMSKEQKLQYSRQVRHIEVLIKYSKRNVMNDGSSLDDFFKNQVKNLQKDLKDLKK